MLRPIYWFKFVTAIFFAVVLWLPNRSASAASQVDLYLFWGDGCPHCAAEKDFLEELQDEVPELKVHSFEVWYDKDNAALFQELAKAYNFTVVGVPVTFIGDNKPLSGFSVSATAPVIREQVNTCRMNGCIDPMTKVDGTANPIQTVPPGDNLDQPLSTPLTTADDPDQSVNLPLLGEVNPRQFGIVGFTVLIGILDGFNACAMWVLCFLLSLLVYSKSRKRIFAIGGTFILVSGLMYYVFIAGWMSFFMFAGSLRAIQLATGIFAVLFGLVAIKDFFWFGKWFSFVIPRESKHSIIKRMHKVTRGTGSLVAAMAGAAVLAAGVNMVELLCSVGLPTVYTSVLSSYHFPAAVNYLLLGVYILFYMLDDMILFTIVVLTMSSRQFTEKFGRISKLLSGLVILILGLIMIVNPKLLTF